MIRKGLLQKSDLSSLTEGGGWDRGCRGVCEGGACLPRLGSGWRGRMGLSTLGMECGPGERSHKDKASNETGERRWSSRCSVSHKGLPGELPAPSEQAPATMFFLSTIHPPSDHSCLDWDDHGTKAEPNMRFRPGS